MSPPAEKAVPDPVSTIARASPSVFSVANSSGEIAVERGVDGVEVGSRVIDHHVEHVAVALDRDRLHPADRTDSLVCVSDLCATGSQKSRRKRGS